MKKITIIGMALFCTFAGKAGKAVRHPGDMLDTRDGGKLRITFFAHASLLFEYEGKRVYVDPVGASADYDRQPDADVILVTHEHFDHFDSAVIREISTPATVLIGNRTVIESFGSGEAMANGDEKSLPFMKIEAVPAYNTTPERQGFHPPGGRDNGYVLTFGGTRVYVSGDSEDTPEMLALEDIDIAFLPVNQPYTMTEEQAARVVNTVRPKVFYPYHYGQTDHRTDLGKLRKLIKGSGAEIRVRPME